MRQWIEMQKKNLEKVISRKLTPENFDSLKSKDIIRSWETKLSVTNRIIYQVIFVYDRFVTALY